MEPAWFNAGIFVEKFLGDLRPAVEKKRKKGEAKGVTVYVQAQYSEWQKAALKLRGSASRAPLQRKGDAQPQHTAPHPNVLRRLPAASIARGQELCPLDPETRLR